MTTGRINQITILTLTSSLKGRSKRIVGDLVKNEFSLSTERRNTSRSRTQSYRIVFESARVKVIKDLPRMPLRCRLTSSKTRNLSW